MSTGATPYIGLIILYIVCCLVYLSKMDVDYADNDINWNGITIISSIIFLPGFIIFCILVIIRLIFLE